MRIHIAILTTILALALPLSAMATGKGQLPGSNPPVVSEAAIQPGVGIGPVLLGMTSAEFYKMAGPPSGSRPYQQLRDEFSQMGTPVDQYNLFVNGFDTGDDVCTSGAPLSFGQVFYRNDRVIHIIISSWCSDSQFQNARTAEGLGFGSSLQDVLNAYGKPEHEYMDQDVGMVYDYYRRGITFVIANDRVDLIEVYGTQ